MTSRLLSVTEEEIRLHSMKFTMDDIARKLRISKSTLYQQASSKAALVKMVCEGIKSQFLEEKEKILSSAMPIKEKLLRYCQLFVDTFWSWPDGVYQDIENHYGEIWEDWISFKLQEFDTMMGLLEEGVKQGVFRKVNLNVLRLILITSTRHLNDPEFLKEQNMTGTDVMRALEEIVLQGIEK